ATHNFLHVEYFSLFDHILFISGLAYLPESGVLYILLFSIFFILSFLSIPFVLLERFYFVLLGTFLFGTFLILICTFFRNYINPINLTVFSLFFYFYNV